MLSEKKNVSILQWWVCCLHDFGKKEYPDFYIRVDSGKNLVVINAKGGHKCLILKHKNINDWMVHFGFTIFFFKCVLQRFTTFSNY